MQGTKGHDTRASEAGDGGQWSSCLTARECGAAHFLAGGDLLDRAEEVGSWGSVVSNQ